MTLWPNLAAASIYSSQAKNDFYIFKESVFFKKKDMAETVCGSQSLK